MSLAVHGLLVETLERGDERLDVAADRLGRRRQVDGAVALDAIAGQVDHVGGGCVGVEHAEQRRRAAHVDVAIVLPRVADAAVDLHAEVDAQVGGRPGERRGDGGGVRELVAPAGGRTAASQTAAVASSVATAMLAQWCFTPWYMAIGRPNCKRTLAYSAARSVLSRATPTASAARIVRAMSMSARRAPGMMSPVAPSSVTRPGAAGGVDVLRRRHRHTGGLGVDDGDVVADRHEDDVGEPRAEHGAGRTGELPAARRHVATERGRTEGRAVGKSGKQARLDVVGAGRDEHRAGDQRRDEHAGGQGPAELLGDHDRLLQPVAGTAEVLGDVEPEPAEVGGLLEERRVGLVGGLQDGAGGGAGLVLGQEVGHCGGERAVVLGDGDRHGPQHDRWRCLRSIRGLPHPSSGSARVQRAPVASTRTDTPAARQLISAWRQPLSAATTASPRPPEERRVPRR